MEVEEPFNPLNKKNLGFSVAEALLAKQPGPLPPGAVHWCWRLRDLLPLGNFSLYGPIAKANRDDSLTGRFTSGKRCPKAREKGDLG